jgi:hypothetical protein
LDVPPHVIPFPTVHPLGAGVITVTGTFPTAAMSAAAIGAVTPFGPTKVVERALPFHCTTVQGNKLFPITESAKAPLPAAAFAGISELIDGTGKDAGDVMVKVRELELIAAPDTKTVAVPRDAVSAYVISALSCVALTNVVGRGEPFQFTTSPFTKFVPVTSNVKPVGLQYGVEAICVVEAEREVMVGTRIENASDGVDVPPPGAGVNTVTCAVAAVKISAAGINVLSCVELR